MQKLFLFIFFFVYQQVVFAQQKAETALKTLEEKYPQEKIHLFFNKEAYVAGETIWFKAYAFSGYVQSFISTNLFVELYDNKKQLLEKTVIPLINAVGHGSLNLRPQWDEGIYYIRAYTTWMLNFDEAFQYIAHIPVYNPNSAKAIKQQPINWKAEAFPESGNLVADVENQISVRLTALGSLPEKYSGYVTEKNQPEKKLMHFNSYNSQVSSFFFTPEKGKEYLIHLSDNAGNSSTLELNPTHVGVLLKAEQIGDQLNISMIFQGIQNGGLNHKLMVQMQNQIIYSAVIRKNQSTVKTSLPINKLMSGIMHLTLFDEKENPVAERLAFVQVDYAVRYNLSPIALSTQPRSLNNWQLQIDSLQSGTSAISITDASVASQRKRSLYSDLWLGDFPSDIDNPNWYFSSEDPMRQLALDALLITEKWRRFNWVEIMSGNFAKANYLPEKYLTYKGTAIRRGRSIVNENLALMLRFKDSSIQFAEVKTDQAGKFMINNVAFYDTVTAFYRGPTSKTEASDVAIKFEKEQHIVPYARPFPPSSFFLSERKEGDAMPPIVTRAISALNNQKQIDNQFIQLKEVTVQAQRKSATVQLNEKLSSALFSTPQETVFDFVNEDQGLLSYTNIFEWLEGRVTGLNFSIQSETGQRIPMMRDGVVSVYVDEHPTDLERIASIPTSEIAMVKVIKGYFLGALGGGGGNGAIAIYTKKAGLNLKSSAPSLPSGILVGYKLPTPYNSLNFTDEFVKRIQQDSRDQLYWNAGQLAVVDKKASLRFFNNDMATQYRITVTGFTTDGKPVFIETLIPRK